MYTKIVNPYTNRKVSIFSKQGKIVLRSYLDKQSSMKRGGKKARGGGQGGPPPADPHDPELYTERRPEEQIHQQFVAAAHPLIAPPIDHPLHKVAYLGQTVVERAREVRLLNEVPLLTYLTEYMADSAGPENRARLMPLAPAEARRILNLLSETAWAEATSIRNLQQYRDWLFGPGPHILARHNAPMDQASIVRMRQHLDAYQQQQQQQ